MDRVTSALIKLTEAAYDLDAPDSEWLLEILHAGLPFLDFGLGVAGAICSLSIDRSTTIIHELHATGSDPACAAHMTRVTMAMPQWWETDCMSAALSAVSPAALALVEHEGAKDALALRAPGSRDANVFVVAPLGEHTTLSRRDRHRWRLAGAELRSGYRLRLALAGLDNPAAARTRSPQDAKRRRSLRDAAIVADRGRARALRRNTETAASLWMDLVKGRSSLVDSFEFGSRRFFLATRSPPGVRDPRGLTGREQEVVVLAAAGESGKLIAAKLGLSRPRVSEVLRSGMRKLSVDTRAALIERAKGLGLHASQEETTDLTPDTLTVREI